MQKRRQMTVFRDLTSPSTTWTCAWARSSDSSPSATRQSPGRVFVDGHGHSLLVQCDVPSSDAAALSVGADGRLESRVTLTATRSSGSTGQSTTLFGVRNVPVCALPITSAPPAPRMLELAACTQVTEINPMFDTAALTRQWVDCKPLHFFAHPTNFVHSRSMHALQRIVRDKTHFMSSVEFDGMHNALARVAVNVNRTPVGRLKMQKETTMKAFL